MAATESLSRTSFPHDHLSPTSLPKPIPILTGGNVPHHEPAPASPSDAMDITPTSTVSMAPPTSSPGSDRTEKQQPAEPGNASPRTNGNGNGSAARNTSPNSNGNPNASTNGTANLTSLGVAASANPTKVVQTAFIHKLYKSVESEPCEIRANGSQHARRR